jgi:hypothetical protein
MVNTLFALDNVNAENITISKPKIENTVELTSVSSPNGIIISHENGLMDPNKQFTLRLSPDMFYGQYGIKEIQLNPFYKKVCKKCEKCKECKKCEECKKIKLAVAKSTSTSTNTNMYIYIIILLLSLIVGGSIYLVKNNIIKF